MSKRYLDLAGVKRLWDATKKLNEITQDVTEEQTERIKTLEDKENSMQATLENISKTGEASAASNVTYNHSDSKLDATNVQQAVDEVLTKLYDNITNINNNLDILKDVVKHVYPRILMNEDDLNALIEKGGPFEEGMDYVAYEDNG